MISIFAFGRVYWDERYYVPDEGLGYALGIIGGIFMLIALTYGYLKHKRPTSAVRPLKHSLRTHMFFGIFGSYLILVHSAFHIGSLNGGVALVSMVLVFLSGVVGRYLYSRIHFGLDSKKASIGDLKHQLQLEGKLAIVTSIPAQLNNYVLKRPGNVLEAFWKLIIFRFVTWRAWASTEKALLTQAQTGDEQHTMAEWKHEYRTYIKSLRKIALFTVYERFFYVWRHAHVPLLVLLLVSGIIHVIAVHMY